MKNQTRFLSLAGFAIVGLLSLGCNPAAKGVEPGTSSKSGTSDGKQTLEGGSGATDVGSIPASFKHDGYEYNGFGAGGKLTYLFTAFAGETPKPGTQSSVFKGIEGEAAKFSVERTGSLQVIGNEQLEVRPDGVYLIGTDQGSPAKPVRLMPSAVSVGTTWSYDYSLTTAGGIKMGFKGKAKASQLEKIKVKAGEFDTMMVTETAEMDKGGTKGTVSSKTWYAKGVGVVQMKMELKDNGGKIVSSTIELSEVGGK